MTRSGPGWLLWTPWRWLVPAIILMAVAVSAHAVPAHAVPAHAALDPRDIALTPDDLVAGFAVDPATTGLTPLPESSGLTYRVDMKRPVTPRTLGEGPILVQQIIVRVDDGTPPDAVLAAVLDELIGRVQFMQTPEGPNDGGTFSLTRTDGEVTLFSVGFVKANFVIVTTWGGRADVTTYPKLLELAGITSGRLDGLLGS